MFVPKNQLMLFIYNFSKFELNHGVQTDKLDKSKLEALKTLQDEVYPAFQSTIKRIQDYIPEQEMEEFYKQYTDRIMELFFDIYFMWGRRENLADALLKQFRYYNLMKFDLEEEKNYYDKLRSHVFYVGNEIPSSLRSYGLYVANTADQCDPKHFMDYRADGFYPMVRICIEKKENSQEWKMGSVLIGSQDNGTLVREHDIVAAYVLQCLGIIDYGTVLLTDYNSSFHELDAEIPLDEADLILEDIEIDRDIGLVWNE